MAAPLLNSETDHDHYLALDKLRPFATVPKPALPVPRPFVAGSQDRPTDLHWHKERGREDWLVQTWFAGNHSDIGGSYPEDESRLSDVALHWMVEELKAAMGEAVAVLDNLLVTSPDALGLQHSERTGMLNAQASRTLFDISA